MRLTTSTAILLLGFGSPTLAHHSFATHYLYDEHVRITGIVTEAKLANPHSFFGLDVTTESGQIERWEVEANSIPLLARAGIVNGVFSLGDEVTITGMRSRRPDRQLMFGLVGTATDGKDYYFIRPDWDTAAPPVTLVRGEAGALSITGLSITEGLNGIWKRIIRDGEILNTDGESPLPLNEKGLLAWTNYNPLESQMRNCIPPDIPSLHTIPYLLEITASDDIITIRHEYYDIHRRFYPGGDATQAHETRQYGVSKTRVEPDALYIETSGFPAMSAGLAGDFDFLGRGKNVPSSEGKYMSETYRLLNNGEVLEMTYVLDDPEYLAEPYNGTMLWARQPEDTRVFDMDCEMAISQRSTDNAFSDRR